MNPLLILLVSKVDILIKIAAIVLIASSIASPICIVGGCIDDSGGFGVFVRKCWKRLILFPVIAFVVLIITPDRNTAILMFVLPKLSDSQLVQRDFPELYGKAMKIINNELDKKLKEIEK